MSQGPLGTGKRSTSLHPVLDAATARKQPQPVGQEARKKVAAAYAAVRAEELQQGGGSTFHNVPAQPVQQRLPSSAQVVPSVDELLSAPRYGLNARALILQAAEHAATTAAATPSVGHHTVNTSGNAPSAPRLSPSALLSAIAPAARPVVQYVPRSSIPRLTRQGVCDTLLGQYLALLLRVMEPDVEQQGDAAAIQVPLSIYT